MPGSDRKTILHFAGADIFPAFKSISLPSGISQGAMLAKADFTDGSSFEHDMFRRFACIMNNTRYIGYVDAIDESCGPLTQLKNLTNGTVLIGRPVQHRDKGMTVYLKAGSKIESCRFSSDGSLIRRSAVAAMEREPYPSAGSVSAEGTTFLVYGANGSLPVKLIAIKQDGSVTHAEVLDEKPVMGSYTTRPSTLKVTILSINPLLGVLESPDNAIIIMLLVLHNQEQFVKTVLVPWRQEASGRETVGIFSAEIKTDMLQPGKRLSTEERC